MNDKPVKIDQYQDRAVVFICGYAINENESNIHTARAIAIQLGQQSIPVYDFVLGNPHRWDWDIDANFVPPFPEARTGLPQGSMPDYPIAL